MSREVFVREARHCNGGPAGPWCGQVATVVCTEKGVLRPLQWYACDTPEHHAGAETMPLAAWWDLLEAEERRGADR